MDIEKEVEAAKAKTLTELLAELQAVEKVAAKEPPGLLDLKIQVNGTPAFCRRVTMTQVEALRYGAVEPGGAYNASLLANLKAMLLAFCLVDKAGKPFFADHAAVNLLPEFGDALWIVCARYNRIGDFRNTDPDTGEPVPGNSRPSKN